MKLETFNGVVENGDYNMKFQWPRFFRQRKTEKCRRASEN